MKKMKLLGYGFKNSKGAFHFFSKTLRFIRFAFFSSIEKLVKRPNKNADSRISKDLVQARKEGASFGGWALTETALRAFVNSILQLQDGVIEFGGGQSTIFFNVSSQKNTDIRVCTWENDTNWYANLNSKITSPRIKISRRYIREISISEFNELFDSPTSAFIKFSGMGTQMKGDSYTTSQIGDSITFYDLSETDIEGMKEFKHVILDGPHGVGRSLAFCLLYQCLRPGSIILIDDYKSFDSIQNLKKLF